MSILKVKIWEIWMSLKVEKLTPHVLNLENLEIKQKLQMLGHVARNFQQLACNSHEECLQTNGLDSQFYGVKLRVFVNL